VLLAGAGLVLQGVSNLRHNNPGFDPEGLVTLRVTLPEGRYPQPLSKAQFVEQIVDRLAAQPGVSSVSASSMLPAIGGEPPVRAVRVAGRPADIDPPPSAGVFSTSEAYFETLGIPVKRGRSLRSSDRQGSLPVAVVSEGFAAKWLEGLEPIGTRVELEGTWRTVVGVVGDVRNFHRNVAPRPTIYVPFAQRPVPGVSLVLKAGGADPVALVAAAKLTVHALDAEQPLRGGESMQTLLEQSMGGFDMTSLLVAVLAGVALALAALGLYGVVAYSVARRTREIGVRMALGAAPGRVVRQVVAEGLRLSAFGGIPGLLLAAAVGRLLSTKLHGVSPVDPVVFTGVILLVTVMVMAASWLPARRASRIDPVTATRTE